MRIGFFILLVLSFLCFGNFKTKALENLEDDSFIEYSKEELEKGVFLNEELFLVNDGLDYKMNNVVVGSDKYLVCGEYKTDLSYPTRFIDTLPYLALYQNNQLVWKIKTDFYGHGRFINGLFLEDKILVVGTFETNLQVKQIGLFEISYNGDVLNHFISNGNANSEVENVYAFSDFYYVTGTTEATDLGHGIVTNINHILVMIFNKQLENFDNLYLSNDKDSRLFRSYFGGDAIYLFGEINGEGYFINKKSNKMLFCVSERLDLDMYKAVNHNEDAQIIAINDEALFFEYDNNLSKVKVTTYGFGLDEKKEQILNLNYYVYEIESFKVNYARLENRIIIANTLINNQTYYDYFTVLDKDLSVVYQTDVKKKDQSILEHCSLIDGKLYSFGSYQKNLYARRLMNLQMVAGECYFNGEKGEKITKQITENVFGTYPLEVNYIYQDYQIRTYEEYKVLPKCTIKDNGVYEKGFNLEFNGKGYLNGEEINSGTTISQNGNYLLKISGKDEDIYYTFIVKDIAIEESSFACTTLELKEAINKKEVEEIKISFNENLSVYQKDNKKSLSYIFVLVGLLVGLIIPLERIGRKRA